MTSLASRRCTRGKQRSNHETEIDRSDGRRRHPRAGDLVTVVAPDTNGTTKPLRAGQTLVLLAQLITTPNPGLGSEPLWVPWDDGQGALTVEKGRINVATTAFSSTRASVVTLDEIRQLSQMP